MTAKLARVVIYSWEYSSIKLYDLLVTWSGWVKQQVEYPIFLFAKTYKHKTRHDRGFAVRGSNP